MRPSRGSIMLLVLVFGSVFFIILGGLIQLVLVEHRAQEQLIGKAQALSIAEAGLEYYKWFLAHYPDDFTNGTGTEGSYELSYNDPETGETGSYTLSVEGSSACGSTQIVDITSSGVSDAYPDLISTLVARYASPTVAGYKTIVNNGSTPGVTFSELLSDFGALKAEAQAKGIFVPAHDTPQDPHLGYQLVFNADGTVSMYFVTKVTTLRTVEMVDNPGHYANDYTLIQTKALDQTVPISESCGLIMIEDNTWIEGVIPSKVTVIAGRSVGSGSAPDVVITGNITYAADDGSVGLTVIGEHNILIAPNAPMDLTIRGVFVAAEGYFGRNNYYAPSAGCTGLYEPRDDLEIIGTIVSNYAPKTKWVGGCSPGDAGYQTETHTLDPDLAESPPPYTPTTSSEKTFISWQQTR